MSGYFNNKYPYTDFEQLNLSWVIETINKVDTDLSGIREECAAIAKAEAQSVADALIIQVDQKIGALTNVVNGLVNDYTAYKQTLDQEMAGFEHEIDLKISDMVAQIAGFRTYIDTKVQASDNLTDIKIAHNNAHIFDVITHELVPQLTVRNYFDGTLVSIQSMFDTLAQLHITDGIDYDTLTARNKTYAEIAALNITYENLLMHGNSLIV